MTINAQNGDAWSNWRAYHIFYHADRSLLLRELVQPLVSQLLRDGIIDHLFFIRYGLGGPHVRLRWRLKDDGAGAAAQRLLAEKTAEFFSRRPSLEKISDEKIRNTNRELLSVDTVAATDADQIYGDNCWQISPLLFEFDRYGGVERMQDSLDLFCLSSVVTLQLLQANTESARGWERAWILRQWLALAFNLAENEEEFLRCVDYGNDFFAGHLQRCADEGEAVFARNGAPILNIVCRELQQLSEAETYSQKNKIVTCARVLAGRIKHLAGKKREYLLHSHMHMAANRLGFINPEEVYLSRMLRCALNHFRLERPQTWKQIWDCRDFNSDLNAEISRQLVASSLQEFVSQPEPIF
ncbi:MAG TPA: lantibiotic dehydratase C-terminal domain-containing protein [Candidatus Angelobacter sp.]|jgi:hypothetical protein